MPTVQELTETELQLLEARLEGETQRADQAERNYQMARGSLEVWRHRAQAAEATLEQVRSAATATLRRCLVISAGIPREPAPDRLERRAQDLSGYHEEAAVEPRS